MDSMVQVRESSMTDRAIAATWFCLAAAPWLNPRASGPSASVDQWLLTGLAVAGMLVLWGVQRGASRRDRALRAARAVIAGWLLAALLSTVIALCQYFGLADEFPSLMSATSAGEPFANLRQRNQFASLTVIGMGALMYFHSAGLSASASMASMLFLAVGNAATASRAGALEMVVLFGMACAWQGPQRVRLMKLSAAGLGAYLVASFVLPLLGDMVPQSLLFGVLGRLGKDEGCASRAVLWGNVLHLITLRPWTGWGWGNLDYAHYMTLYAGPRFCDVLDNAHNLPLQLAVELGIPFSLGALGAAAWFIWRQAPWREKNPIRRAAWVVIIIIGIHSMVEYPLWYGPFLLTFCMCVGFIARRTQSESGQHHEPESRLAWWPLLLSGVLVLVVVFCGWQYRRASQIYLPASQRQPEYRDDTLERIRDAYLFQDQIRFAELTLTPLTAANARWTYDTAAHLLHFSPEPRVIEKLIESAMLLKLDGEAAAHMQRYRAAFPKDYARWLSLRS